MQVIALKSNGGVQGRFLYAWVAIMYIKHFGKQILVTYFVASERAIANTHNAEMAS